MAHVGVSLQVKKLSCVPHIQSRCVFISIHRIAANAYIAPFIDVSWRTSNMHICTLDYGGAAQHVMVCEEHGSSCCQCLANHTLSVKYCGTL